MPKQNPEQQARRSELIVLFLLMESQWSGYQIRTLIRSWRIDRYLPVSPTTVYRALERLAGEGCLSSAEHRQGRYPVSTVYTITPKGAARYRQLAMDESSFSRTPYSLSASLGLCARLSRVERAKIASTWRKAAMATAAEIDARIKDKAPGHTYGKAYPEWLLLDHERDMLRAEARWMAKYARMLATKHA
jgi:DNA-binding PadR family transcriptional regulator